MKRNKIVSYFLMIVMIVVLLCSDTPSDASSEIIIGYITDGSENVNFRTGPGTTYAKVMHNNTAIKLNSGQQLTILDTTNTAWYKVSVNWDNIVYEGYVSSAYISISNSQTLGSGSTSEEFEAYLTLQGFPESYKQYLRTLHAKYPNWTFNAVQTGLDWNTVIANESSTKGAKNLVQCTSSYPRYNWRSTDAKYYNSETKVWTPSEGSTWYAASDELIAYYMDPRTYLYESYIFAFENMSYVEGVCTIEGVEAILNGSFMSNKVPAGETSTYGQLILESAKTSGVSPYHLASRMRQEMGLSMGVAAAGTVVNGLTVYNYFNIGANTGVWDGLIYAAGSGAYGRPWTTPSKAVSGGSEFVGKSYISVGQNTLYTQKFNVTNAGSLYSHQYMTNVQAVATESNTSYRAYSSSGILGQNMTFSIPVYKNMPETAVVKPSEEMTTTPDNGGTDSNNGTDSVTIGSYTVNNGMVTGIAVNTSVDTFLSNFSIEGATVTGADGASKTGNVGTGDIITYAGQTANVVIYGDINGDGLIGAIDILRVKKSIVGILTLSGSYKTAADVNRDGSISALDLLRIKKQIVGIYTIEQ